MCGNAEPPRSARAAAAGLGARAHRALLRGMTLLELMIVLVIVALLASVAYPSYRDHVVKARRTDAKTALLDLSVRQERYFSVYNAYASDARKLGYATDFPVQVTDSGKAWYELVLSSPSTDAYSASARPKPDQATDACGTYTLDHTGAKGNIGATRSNCW